jgi:hypothetical protein
MSYIHCITTEILSVGLPTYVALAQFLFKKKKKELLPDPDCLTQHWVRRLVARSPLQQHASLSWSPVNGSHWASSGPTVSSRSRYFSGQNLAQASVGHLRFPTPDGNQHAHAPWRRGDLVSARCHQCLDKRHVYSFILVHRISSNRARVEAGRVSRLVPGGTNQIDRLRACGTCQTRTLSPSVRALARGY